MKYIGLLDCNNFFVSCERLFRPDLRRRPVLVLSSNDGCVVARSQEVKDIGVPMGIPLFQIKDIIKDNGITVFSSNFTLYRDISRRVMAELSGLVSEVEQYSVDEAFFAIEAETEEALLQRLFEIKQTVERVVGVPVSLGVAASKTQAKYASVLAKKGQGAFIASDAWWKQHAAEVLLRDIWGVGRRLQVQYEQHGIVTVADLLGRPTQQMASLFGVVGVRLQAELAGTPVHAVDHSLSIPHSIMSTRSFQRAVHSKNLLKDALCHHVQSVAMELREKGLCAGVITILARPSRHSDHITYRGVESVTLSVPTNDTGRLLKFATQAADRLYNPEIPYKKAGIVVSGLIKEDMISGSLWEDAAAISAGKVIDELTDSLRDRYGRPVIERGRFTERPLWESRHDHISPAYTTAWSQLQTVTTG